MLDALLDAYGPATRRRRSSASTPSKAHARRHRPAGALGGRPPHPLPARRAARRSPTATVARRGEVARATSPQKLRIPDDGARRPHGSRRPPREEVPQASPDRPESGANRRTGAAPLCERCLSLALSRSGNGLELLEERGGAEGLRVVGRRAGLERALLGGLVAQRADDDDRAPRAWPRGLAQLARRPRSRRSSRRGGGRGGWRPAGGPAALSIPLAPVGTASTSWPRAADERLDHLPDRVGVFDDEDAHAVGSQRGNVTVTRTPPPRPASTGASPISSSAPCAAAISGGDEEAHAAGAAERPRLDLEGEQGAARRSREYRARVVDDEARPHALPRPRDRSADVTSDGRPARRGRRCACATSELARMTAIERGDTRAPRRVRRPRGGAHARPRCPAAPPAPRARAPRCARSSTRSTSRSELVRIALADGGELGDEVLHREELAADLLEALVDVRLARRASRSGELLRGLPASARSSAMSRPTGERMARSVAATPPENRATAP